MSPVVLPPGAVERCTIGEVSVQRIVFYGDIGYGAPLAVARHIDAVEEQVCLHRKQFAALVALHPGLRLSRNFRNYRSLWNFQDFRNPRYGLALADDDYAGSTQRGEVCDKHPAPKTTAVECLQRTLQLGILLTRHILVEETLHPFTVRVAVLHHALVKIQVILGFRFDHQTVALRYPQVVLHEVVECLLALLAEELVESHRAFGRSGTTHLHTHNLKAVAAYHGKNRFTQLLKRLVAFGKVPLRHFENHRGSILIEVIIADVGIVAFVDDDHIGISGIVGKAVLNAIVGKGTPGIKQPYKQEHQYPHGSSNCGRYGPKLEVQTDSYGFPCHSFNFLLAARCALLCFFLCFSLYYK